MAATLDWPGPLYIRLAKGGDPVVSEARHGFALGQGILMREPGRILLVSTGVMTTRALAAAELLAERGVAAGVLHLHTVKPLDETRLLSLAREVETVVSIEEHILAGGLGSAIAELFMDRLAEASPRLLRLGLPDRFPEKYGSQDDLLRHFGLTAEGIAERALAPRLRSAA